MDSLFNPNPESLVWLSAVPSEADLEKATPDQLNSWYVLNAEIAFIHTAWSTLENVLALLLSAVLRVKIAQATVILGTFMANKPKRDLM